MKITIIQQILNNDQKHNNNNNNNNDDDDVKDDPAVILEQNIPQWSVVTSAPGTMAETGQNTVNDKKVSWWDEASRILIIINFPPPTHFLEEPPKKSAAVCSKNWSFLKLEIVLLSSLHCRPWQEDMRKYPMSSLC